MTVIGVHNAQAFVVLRAREHPPAVNTLSILSGLGSFPFALFGAVPTCMASLSCAILTSAGPHRYHYVGAVVYGAMVLVLALFAPSATALALALPAGFVGLLAGLVMLDILKDAFTSAFAGRCRLAGVVSFLVSVSEVSVFNIGAPFWGLVFGFAVAWLLEREDLRALRASG